MRTRHGRRPDRLSALDAAFLPLENDTQPMLVGSVLLLEGPVPAFQDFSEHIESRLASVPRYRQRVGPSRLGVARPTWVDDPRFAVVDHVRLARLPAPGGDDDLRSLVSRVMAQRLDVDRPLWEAWMVDGLADGRWAAIVKAHHAMVDGVSGDDLLEALLDRDAAPGSAVPVGVRAPARMVLRSPLRWPTASIRQARASLRGLAQVAHADLPPSLLSGPLSPQRRWAWAGGDLAAVKAVKGATGCTVNDVVLAAVAGGLRRYLIERGRAVDAVVVRCIVPVSVRTPDERGRLGNRVAAVFVELPIGTAGARERLADVARQMDELKAGGMTKGVLSALRAADYVPYSLVAKGARAYAKAGQRRVNLITTNVPGPQHPLYLLGRRLVRLIPYVPTGQWIRVAIGVISYDGRLAIGVTGDAVAVPDVDRLCADIEASMDELVALRRR